MRDVSAAETDVATAFSAHGLGTLVALEPLSGGSVAEVYKALRGDAPALVVKRDVNESGALSVEGRMLQYMQKHGVVPTPAPILIFDRLLVMSFVDGNVGAPGAEEDAADKLAALHRVTAKRFGFSEDTVIGGLPQPNPWGADWPAFFVEHRLIAMANQAHAAGRLPLEVRKRIDRALPALTARIPSDIAPSLIHGDIWSGNVLGKGAQVSAFLDPALYFAHNEIELAFITLFNTFGDRFFARYQEEHALSDGFWDELRHVYNLYPLLVHVRLFGGSYVSQVERILQQFGAR